MLTTMTAANFRVPLNYPEQIPFLLQQQTSQLQTIPPLALIALVPGMHYDP